MSGSGARAAVIAFVLLFNGLFALPTPGEPSLERLSRPFEREELERWASLFRGAGFDMDAERLAHGYVAFARWVEQARALVLAPIIGWMDLTQTHQSWRLFGTPDRIVSALRITAHGAAGERVLYESGDPDRRWNAGFLEYRRIRADYNPSRRGPPPTYAAFCQRVSEEIFARHRDVQRVSVALLEKFVLLPHEAARGTGLVPDRAQHVLEFTRPVR